MIPVVLHTTFIRKTKHEYISLIRHSVSVSLATFGELAQLVERRVRNAEVRGSIPLLSRFFIHCSMKSGLHKMHLHVVFPLVIHQWKHGVGQWLSVEG